MVSAEVEHILAKCLAEKPKKKFTHTTKCTGINLYK